MSDTRDKPELLRGPGGEWLVRTGKSYPPKQGEWFWCPTCLSPEIANADFSQIIHEILRPATPEEIAAAGDSKEERQVMLHDSGYPDCATGAAPASASAGADSRLNIFNQYAIDGWTEDASCLGWQQFSDAVDAIYGYECRQFDCDGMCDSPQNHTMPPETMAGRIADAVIQFLRDKYLNAAFFDVMESGDEIKTVVLRVLRGEKGEGL